MHTSTMGAFEAKTHFSQMLEAVENGEQVIITKHGQPVAKVVPFLVKEDRTLMSEVIAQIEAFSQLHTLGDDLDWKTLRDEGRK